MTTSWFLRLYATFHARLVQLWIETTANLAGVTLVLLSYKHTIVLSVDVSRVAFWDLQPMVI